MPESSNAPPSSGPVGGRWSRAEIEAAIADLERATETFRREALAIGRGLEGDRSRLPPGPGLVHGATDPAAERRLAAERCLEGARRVAEGMVAERQQRLAELSDGIVDRAEALTAGMEDAERIRRQFDRFLRALSETAGRIAIDAGGPRAVEGPHVAERQPAPQQGAAAA